MGCQPSGSLAALEISLGKKKKCHFPLLEGSCKSQWRCQELSAQAHLDSLDFLRQSHGFFQPAGQVITG